MIDAKSAIFNRSLGGKSLPDAVRIELNRLNRAHVREVSQARCDEIEARIQAIEAEYYAKAKPPPRRTAKPAEPPAETPAAKKRAAKPTIKPDKPSPKRPAKPAAKSTPKQRRKPG